VVIPRPCAPTSAGSASSEVGPARCRTKRPLPVRPARPVAFLIALTALTLLFLIFAIRRSNRTTLRGDEIMTLFHNRDGKSLLEVALKGERARSAGRRCTISSTGRWTRPPRAALSGTDASGLSVSLHPVHRASAWRRSSDAFRVRRQESQRGIPSC